MDNNNNLKHKLSFEERKKKAIDKIAKRVEEDSDISFEVAGDILSSHGVMDCDGRFVFPEGTHIDKDGDYVDEDGYWLTFDWDANKGMISEIEETHDWISATDEYEGILMFVNNENPYYKPGCELERLGEGIYCRKHEELVQDKEYLDSECELLKDKEFDFHEKSCSMDWICDKCKPAEDQYEL